ncbi:MAG: hypothetical protein SGPRY_006037 [Prymnesium sp.]
MQSPGLPLPRLLSFVRVCSNGSCAAANSHTRARHQLLWLLKNPGLRVQHIHSTDGEDLIKRHYPKLYASYAALQTGVERSDFLRYLVIHRYGGVYADDDIIPILPLNHWLSTFGWKQRVQNALIVGIENSRPLRIAQFLFASVPGHILLSEMVQEVQSRISSLHFDKNRFSVLQRTGPLAWTATIIRCIRLYAWPVEARNISLIDERRGRLFHLRRDGQWWDLLILPYRAFGFNRGHASYLLKEPRCEASNMFP